MRKDVEIYQNVSEDMHSSIDVLIRRLSEFPFRPNSFRSYDQKLGKIANYLSSHKVYIGVSRVVMPKSFALENIPESHKLDGLELSKKELESKINQNDSSFMLMRTVSGYFLVKSFDLNDSHHYALFEPSSFDGKANLRYVSVLTNPGGHTKTRHVVDYQTIRPIFEVKKEDGLSNYKKILPSNVYPPEIWEARLYNLIDKVVKRNHIRRRELTSKEITTLEHFSLRVSDIRKYLIENYPHLEFKKTEKIIHIESYEKAQEMRQKLGIYFQKNPWRAHGFLPPYYRILIEKLYDGDIVKALTNQKLKIDLDNYKITKLGKSLVKTSKLFKEEDPQTLFLRRLESEKAIRLVNEDLTALARNAISKGYVKRRGSDLEKRIIEILSSNPSETIKRAELIRRNRPKLGYSDLEISGALRILKEDSKISIKSDSINLNETVEMPKIDPFTAVLGVTNDLVTSRKSFSSFTIQINLYKKFGLDLSVYRIEKYLDEIGRVIGFEKVGIERIYLKKSAAKYPKSILKPMESHVS